MPKVLYNKYRSSDFDQLIGQEHVTKILKNAVKSGRISHAYLFVGSRGTGKTSSARILAKALNCTNLKIDGNPCNECPTCLSIAQGKFLDLIEIDAASNRGIDQIRELKEKLEFSPVEGKYKIYIIDEVHMLTKEAFNALLKTLEEPPAHIIFMLATTDVHKLTPTILSRCQRYDLRLGSDKEIGSVLTNVAKEEGTTLDDGALKLLVESSKGSYRDGLSLLDAVVSGQINSEKPEVVTEAEVRKILGIPDHTMVYQFLSNLISKDGVGALSLIDEIESKGTNINQFVKYCLSTLQDILVKKISGKESEYDFAEKLDANKVTAIIGLFLSAERNLKNTAIPSLVLDMLIVQVGALSEGAPVSKVVKKEPEVTQERIKPVNVDVKEEAKVEKSAEIAEEQEEEEVTDSSSVKSKAVDITFENIQKEWKRIVEKVKPASGHLFAFLDSAKLLEFKNNSLKLEVPFSFHKDRIESVGSREALNKVFMEIFGAGFKVECEVNGNAKKKKQVSADIVMQNIAPKQTTTAPVTALQASAGVAAPRRISKKVEAIFEGM